MNKTARIQISVAAFFGVTAVISGALGAHALEEVLAERGRTAVWETAVLYHLAHAVSLLALGIWSEVRRGSRLRVWAAGCWAGGVLLFSGSLYLLALGGPAFLGPVTPLGGVLFILGWIAVFAAAWRGSGEEGRDG